MKRDVNGLKGSIEYMNQVAEQAAFPKLKEQLKAESLVRRCQEIESDLETALDQKNLMMIDKAIQNAVALKYDCPILHEARRERKNLQHLATGILTNIGESCRAHDTKELTRCQAQAKSLGFTSPRLSQLDVCTYSWMLYMYSSLKPVLMLLSPCSPSPSPRLLPLLLLLLVLVLFVSPSVRES